MPNRRRIQWEEEKTNDEGSICRVVVKVANDNGEWRFWESDAGEMHWREVTPTQERVIEILTRHLFALLSGDYVSDNGGLGSATQFCQL